MSFITVCCHINENSCFVNGETVLHKNEESPDSWFKQLYKELGIEYPKFYKMDMLSQGGFIGSEFIKRAKPDLISKYKDDEIALLFANSKSSADTDIRFKESFLEKKTPSPSLFVYTLPNIVLGEISIRNKWFGENMFAILPKFTPDFFVQYGTILLNTGSKAMLAGWLGISEGRVQVFMFLVETENTNGEKFDAENILKYSGL
ncbi:hypothetical protein [Dyadobacter sp. 3J3]|uniref:hypothetical protein n=1 Tax=Dyadobacter sp. 3J3 TaxID=2606600 RepID=UPI001356C877|nr:hypothetical protein [Dyadobacter sp. 3J3]